MKNKFDIDDICEYNVQWAFENWDFYSFNNVINFEKVGNGIDLVLYDVADLEYIDSYNDLVIYCDENGADEENFEVDRVTFVKDTL